MPYWMEFLAATVMFFAGLRLSAFCSGSEIGFYRLSPLRLGIDARAGDRRAATLLWFAQHPAYFVTTCLVSNNVANYLCTAAISWGTVLLFGLSTETLEVAATLVFAPIIFQFGELLPKSIYYLTPYSRLRKELPWFLVMFRLLVPLSWPLVRMTRLFEKMSGQTTQPGELVLGRNRLVQLMQHGRQEGILTDLQSRLANGLLQLAPQRVLSSMIPSSRVLGLEETATAEEMIEFARKYGVAAVALSRAGDPSAWYGYVWASELLTQTRGEPVVHMMPVIASQTSKLEALHQLQVNDASYGVVVQDGTVLGVVARNGLVEQVYRPAIGSAAHR